jgi:ABC-type branched-subunit amino acid transport system substrate-binding protein
MSTIPLGRYRTRTRVGVALLAAGLATVAACSSSKSSSSSTTAAPSATTGAGAPTTATPSGTPKTVTVTLIGSYTGPFASSTKSIQNVFQYVFDQVNAGTGLVSAPGYTFKLTASDDGAVPSRALDLARTALSNGSKIVNLVGHAEVNAVAPLTNAGQLLGTEEDPPDVSADGTRYPYNFDFYANDYMGIDAQMKRAAAQNLKKFAVVAGAGDQYQGYVNDVNKYLSDDPGASIVFTQRFDPTTSDFSSIVTKVQQSGADSVWFFATGPPVQSFYTGMQSANLNIPIFNAFGSLTCLTCYTMPPSFLSHVYLAAPANVVLDSSKNPLIPLYGQLTQQLWTHFNATSPVDKATLGGGLEDIAYGIVWGVVHAGGDDPAKLKATYEGTSASGGVGFVSPEIKYSWTATNHGGFPVSKVLPVVFGAVPAWPGWHPQA